jgi:peptidoglycan/LPS O-acetylase OafA/YrhL
MQMTGTAANAHSSSTESAFPEGRYDGLDGLRGLAALSVFILHAIDMAAPGAMPERLTDSPLHVLWDGTAAVDLFFVLSGFVLALPYVGSRPRSMSYLSFAIRRVFRLYPAYWACVALALLFRTYLYAPAGMVGLSPWIQKFWATPLTLGDLVRHALMIGPSFDTAKIDPVLWSLVTEMRMSLMFPLFLLAMRGVRSWRGGVLSLAAALAISLGAPRLGIHTFTYLPMFIGGAVVAALRSSLLPWAARLRPVAAFALAALALFLYDIRFSLFGLRFDYYASDLVMALGSALLVLLVAGRAGWGQRLCSRPIAFLGRVSYSFYLIHLPILMLLASYLDPLVHSMALCALVGLPLSLAASDVLQRLFEAPFHELGRRAARFVDSRARALWATDTAAPALECAAKESSAAL